MTGRLAVVYLTGGGARLAGELKAGLPEARVADCAPGVRARLGELWNEVDGLVCIMAAGIVVRAVAPLLRDKHSDPAVVVVDEAGHHAVSLLSGHLGGANGLAAKIAALIGAAPVITTASDVLGRTALDLWCRDLGLAVSERTALTRAMGLLVNRGRIRLYSELDLPDLPPDLEPVSAPDEAELVVGCMDSLPGGAALLRPRALSVGVGCNRGTGPAALRAAVEQTCQRFNLSMESIRTLASIDLKVDEQGLLRLARDLGVPIRFFSRERLNRVRGVSFSAAAFKATGARGVAEPAALLAARDGRLLVAKQVFKDATVAIAADRVLQANS